MPMCGARRLVNVDVKVDVLDRGRGVGIDRANKAQGKRMEKIKEGVERCADRPTAVSLEAGCSSTMASVAVISSARKPTAAIPCPTRHSSSSRNAAQNCDGGSAVTTGAAHGCAVKNGFIAAGLCGLTTPRGWVSWIHLASAVAARNLESSGSSLPLGYGRGAGGEQERRGGGGLRGSALSGSMRG